MIISSLLFGVVSLALGYLLLRTNLLLKLVNYKNGALIFPLKPTPGVIALYNFLGKAVGILFLLVGVINIILIIASLFSK